MRTLLLYLLLVGVPVLGLLGILVLGAHLEPPRAVGGTWRLQVEPASGDAPPCLSPGRPRAAPTLVIFQSGPRLDMRLADAGEVRLAGRIRGDSLSGRSRAGSVGTCAGETALQLRAAVLGRDGDLRLRGALTAPGCACAPVSFTALPQTGD